MYYDFKEYEVKKYLMFSIACLISAIIAGFLATVLIWGAVAIDGIICGIVAVVSAFMAYDFFMVYFELRFKSYKIFDNDDNLLFRVRAKHMGDAVRKGQKKSEKMCYAQLDKMSNMAL